METLKFRSLHSTAHKNVMCILELRGFASNFTLMTPFIL